MASVIYLDVTVHTDNFQVFSQHGIVISATSQVDPVATAKVLGVLFRKASSVMPAMVPTPRNATFATKRWSPFRIASMAGALAMHTHDTRFTSLCLTPAAVDSMSFLVSASDRSANTMVHLHYKGHELHAVIRRAGQNRATHTVRYPAKLVLSLHEYSGFKWLGPEFAVNQVISLLWQLLVTAL